MKRHSFFQDKRIRILFCKLNLLVRGYSGIEKKRLLIYINIKDKKLLDKVFGNTPHEHTIYGIPVRVKKEGEPVLSRQAEEY